MMGEGSGEDELAQLVSDHVLGDVDGDEGSAVVDRDRVLDEVGEDGRTSGPGLDDFLVSGLVLLLDSLEKTRIAVRTLFETSRHVSFSSWITWRCAF